LNLIGDIDEKKTESVRVQTKSSGSWWIIGREKEEVSEEPAEIKQTEKKKPSPMRRATVGESSPTTDKSQSEKNKTETETETDKPAPKRRATWLTRSSSNASLTAATPPESSKDVVKTEPASSSGFWKLLPSSSNSTTPPVVAAAAAVPAAAATTTAVVPVSAAPQGGEGAYPLIHSHPFHTEPRY
jgi:hypothetical protein